MFMLERDLIQSRGVKNTLRNGEVVGFEFRIRMPSYRGMAASLIDGIFVTLDQSRKFDPNQTRWRLSGQEYSLEQLQMSNEVRWQLEEAATILVDLPGGIAPGIHNLDIELLLRMSYIPSEHQPSRYKASKKVTVIL